MTVTRPGLSHLTEAAVLCLEGWRGDVLARIGSPQETKVPALLRGVLHDADAFDFVRDIFDYVALPSDAFTAALGLNELAERPPESLPARLRLALKVGGIASYGLPWGVVPLVKQRFRAHLQELVVSAQIVDTPSGGSATLRDLVNDPVDLELIGAPVFGATGLTAHVRKLTTLATTPGVTHLSVNLADLAPMHDEWGIDSVPGTILTAGHKFFEAAATHGVHVTFQALSFAQALIMPKLAATILEDASLRELKFGVEVLAELPESLTLVRELQKLHEQIPGASHGPHGHPFTVRLTTRSIAGAEMIRSIERGLAVPTLDDQEACDAHWVRLCDALFSPEHVAHVVPVVATEHPTLVAIAQVMWQARSLPGSLNVVMQRGRAPQLETAFIRSGIAVRRATPVVEPQDFAHALPAIMDTLAFVLADGAPFQMIEDLLAEDQTAREVVQRERERIRAATNTAMRDEEPGSQRLQHRGLEWAPSERDSPLMYRPPTEAYRFDTGGLTAQVMRLQRNQGESTEPVRVATTLQQRIPVISTSGFASEPDTDAALAHNREWMREQLRIAQASARTDVTQVGMWAVDATVERGNRAGEAWANWTHNDRATIIRRCALALVAARDRMTQTIARERGLPAREIDHEIGVAIDSARYYASRAEGLRTVRGATFTPNPLTLIALDQFTAPGEAAEILTAVLASGSGAVVACHDSIAPIVTVLVEEFVAAGLPEGTATVVTSGFSDDPTGIEAADPDASEQSRAFDALVIRLASHTEFEHGIFAVSRALAERIRRRRPDLSRDVRVRGQGSVILTPSADLTAAVPEIVRSALAGSGGHHLGTGAVILVQGAGKPQAFLDALTDAVGSARAGHTGRRGDADTTEGDPLTLTVAPLPELPTPAQLRALTELAPGETWLVQPQQLDEGGLLWSPGLRTGLTETSPFWHEAIGVPVIGITKAHSLTEAIRIQDHIGSGDVAALQTLDPSEATGWLAASQHGTLALNRATVNARVERFPWGTRGDAQSTHQPHAGGPNRLIPLGEWALRRGTQSDTLHLRGLEPVIQALIETVQPHLTYGGFDLLRRAALADELAWRTQLGLAEDVSGLTTERNITRYMKVPVHLRLAEAGSVVELSRLLAAGLLAASPITISTGLPLPESVRRFLDAQQINHTEESDESWLERATLQGSSLSGEGEIPAERIRLIGGDARRVVEWLSSRTDIGVWAGPVTMAGPVELLGFLREQTISVAATRHGMIVPLYEVDEWIQELSR